MNIFEILEGKVVVYGDAETGVIVTWNGSATFELFCERANGLFDAIEVRTRYDVDSVNSIAQARKIAEEFVEDMMDLLTD
jgi:hypothetical protein